MILEAPAKNYRGKLHAHHVCIVQAAVGDIKRAHPDIRQRYADANLSPKRCRWDVFWAARRANPDVFNALIDEVYTYADDTHLDTLLRHLVCDDASWTVSEN